MILRTKSGERIEFTKPVSTKRCECGKLIGDHQTRCLLCQSGVVREQPVKANP